MNYHVFKRKRPSIKNRKSVNEEMSEYNKSLTDQNTRRNKHLSKQLFRTIKCEQILDNVACLIHSTNLIAFKNILENFKITAHEGDPELVIFGNRETLNKGAFFQVLFKCNSGAPIIETSICDLEIVLVFSKLLLQRDDYHISNNWIGGMQFKPLIPNKRMDVPIKSYGNMVDFINENLTCSKNDRNVNINKNECVFMNDVSLSYLREIWVCNHYPRIVTRSEKKGNTYNRVQIQAPITSDKYVNVVRTWLTRMNLHDKIKIKEINKVPETERDECHVYR